MSVSGKISSLCIVGLIVGCLWGRSAPVHAEIKQPTVRRNPSLSGEALVFFQGGSPLPASKDMLLREGDAYELMREPLFSWNFPMGVK